jgi:hypothetical protein
MRKSRKIRIKSAGHPCPLLGAEGDCLTRGQAIERIRRALTLSVIHPEAARLIGLFSIAPEELAEAGLCYETLKVLEGRALFL